MNASHRVLIIDRSAESREVLRTLLEHRGATTFEADHPLLGLELADKFHPDLIVLDADSAPAPGAATDSLQQIAQRTDTPIVILGTLPKHSGVISAGQIVAKPYHYGPLIRKIDDLLAAA